MNGMMIIGTGVPGTLARARSVQKSGKSLMAVVPSSPTAIPRKSASVPIVTASEGRPTKVTRAPLIAPAMMPTTIAARPASGSPQPAWTPSPVTTEERPTMLATERSISSVMMISVIGRAIRRIGASSRMR